MAHRRIEEAFHAIRPRGRWHRGIPDAPTVSVGVTSNNGDLSSSLSQAGQQIAQLQAAYQQQVALITANTQAIQNNTSSRAGGSALGTAGNIASGLFGGAFGLLSPLISGIAGLFGGGKSAPPPIPYYVPPAPVQIGATLTAAPQVPAQAAVTLPGQPVQSAPNSSDGTAALTSALSAVFGERPASTQPLPYTPAYAPPLAVPSAVTPAVVSPAGGALADSAPPASGPATNTVSNVTVNVSAMDSQSFMDRSADIANAVREAMLNLHPINDVIANL